ncbi:LysR family transcriptional regulator [Vibrio astriarenae]
MPSNVNWNQFAIFIEVYRLQSISRAAEVLNMSQPGVSNALRRLQAGLGVDLFVRKGRGIAPTVAANLLAEQLEQATQMIDVALEQVVEFDPAKPHRFDVTTNEVIQHLLLPYIDHPIVGNCKINLSMTPSSDIDISQKLVESQTDLVVDIQDNLMNSFSSQAVLKDEIVVVASVSHPQLQQGDVLTEELYFSQKHIVQSLRRANQFIADFFSLEPLRQRDIVTQSDSILSAMMLASQTHHLTVVSRSLANLYAQKMGLNMFELPFEVRSFNHTLLWHRRMEHSSGHRWLRETIQQLLTMATQKH